MRRLSRARRESAERKARVTSMIATGDYHVVPFGGTPNQRCKIIWGADGSVNTPPNGFQYIREAGEVYMPEDLPTLVSDDDDEQHPTPSIGDPIQRGDRPETITSKTIVVRVTAIKCIGWMPSSRVHCASQGLKCKPRLPSHHWRRTTTPNFMRVQSCRSFRMRIIAGCDQWRACRLHV